MTNSQTITSKTIMRRIFSISSVLLTLFCIVNLFLPLGSLPVIFAALALILAIILLFLSKTKFKKNLPKVLIGINIILTGIFIAKPILFEDKTAADTATEQEREKIKLDANLELELLEQEGIINNEFRSPEEVDSVRNKIIDTVQKVLKQTKELEKSVPSNSAKEEEIQFEQPTFK